MTTLLVVVGIVLLVAYANGANDTFKGVATLFGSGTSSYPRALTWATVTTFAGSVTALFLAEKLVRAFSGRGLVPEALISGSGFLASVGVAAAGTVLLATFLSLPVSTTHALTGALVGAGLVLAGPELRWGALGTTFFLPLLLSPVAALALTLLLYPTLRWTARRLGIRRESCICVNEKWVPVGTGTVAAAPGLEVAACDSRQDRYQGTVLAIDAERAVNGAHYLSAGAVSFARGLNDTPKIVALLIASQALGLRSGMILVGAAMALGAIVHARRVGETMSRKITPLNHGQGVAANLVTAALVIAASRFGLPVSTTHVSCGSLFGIGMVTGKADRKIVGSIVIAWVVTLPLAAALGAAAASLIGA
ncbi:MAG TPA: inorganic phosphate transporter [Planctomycetota bacterium]|nr:inorganic phosphate transporter [Planctomycetota bacterium]